MAFMRVNHLTQSLIRVYRHYLFFQTKVDCYGMAVAAIVRWDYDEGAAFFICLDDLIKNVWADLRLIYERNDHDTGFR